ncbi:MAG TPA: ribonuclease P protein component [Streptosporangiaceae bacterium]|jgi:ribonuclease P protein component|nr:ribonuclease P protein component [Streptosporangiaceae bacterium]
MLPSAARMRRRTEFSAAIGSGSRVGRPLLVGHLLVRDGVTEPPRIGFTVSRAVGPAVVRNRVKRRLRHLAVGYLQSLPAGSLLVLRANPPAATASQVDLAAELGLVVRSLLRRQGGAV